MNNTWIGVSGRNWVPCALLCQLWRRGISLAPCGFGVNAEISSPPPKNGVIVPECDVASMAWKMSAESRTDRRSTFELSQCDDSAETPFWGPFRRLETKQDKRGGGEIPWSGAPELLVGLCGDLATELCEEFKGIMEQKNHGGYFYDGPDFFCQKIARCASLVCTGLFSPALPSVTYIALWNKKINIFTLGGV